MARKSLLCVLLWCGWRAVCNKVCRFSALVRCSVGSSLCVLWSAAVGMYGSNVLLRSALLRGRVQPFVSSPRFVHPVSLFLFFDVLLSSGLLKCPRLCHLAFIACHVACFVDFHRSCCYHGCCPFACSTSTSRFACWSDDTAGAGYFFSVVRHIVHSSQNTLRFDRPGISYVSTRTKASGAVDEGGDVGVVREERLGSCSQAVMPGCHKPEAELAEESKESEVPVRGGGMFGLFSAR